MAPHALLLLLPFLPFLPVATLQPQAGPHSPWKWLADNDRKVTEACPTSAASYSALEGAVRGGECTGHQQRAEQLMDAALTALDPALIAQCLKDRSKSAAGAAAAGAGTAASSWARPPLHRLLNNVARLDPSLSRSLFTADPHSFLCPRTATATASTNDSTWLRTGAGWYQLHELWCVTMPRPLEDVIEVLVNGGTLQDEQHRADSGTSALHLACSIGNARLVRKLLDLGANASVTDAAGRLPVHVAAIYGYRSIVEDLLVRRRQKTPRLRVAMSRRPSSSSAVYFSLNQLLRHHSPRSSSASTASCAFDSISADQFDAEVVRSMYLGLSRPLLVRRWAAKLWRPETWHHFSAASLAAVYGGINVTVDNVPYETVHFDFDDGQVLQMPLACHLQASGFGISVEAALDCAGWTVRTLGLLERRRRQTRKWSAPTGAADEQRPHTATKQYVFDSDFIHEHVVDQALAGLHRDFIQRLVPAGAAGVSPSLTYTDDWQQQEEEEEEEEEKWRQDAPMAMTTADWIAAKRLRRRLRPRSHQMQLVVGGPSSGTPFHYHGPAANVLFAGRRTWTLLPPQHRIYSRVFDDRLDSSDVVARHGFVCEQRPGDLIVVPARWAHRVLNLRPVIALALESQDLS